jgi:hypothetical protein
MVNFSSDPSSSAPSCMILKGRITSVQIVDASGRISSPELDEITSIQSPASVITKALGFLVVVSGSPYTRS